MLNSITIKNFESHKDTNIDLHPGVNVLVGESDEGKSGVIRAFKWNAKNRPKGDGYRNDDLDPKKDKKEVVQVGIIYDKSGLVIRERDGVSGGINHYQIDSEEPLRALRTDVPDEVQEVTKIKDVNIQGQHPSEQYFLLGDKPGQVAKKFNKVAGLTIMDDALSEVKSRIRICNATIAVRQKELENFEEAEKNTQWIDKAEKFGKKLKKFKSKLEDSERKFELLEELVSQVHEINSILKSEFKGLDDALLEVKSLESDQLKISDQEKQTNKLSDSIRSIKKLDLDISVTLDTSKAQKSLKSLISEQLKIQEYSEKAGDLVSLINQWNTISKKVKIAEEDYTRAKDIFVSLKGSEICPTCERGPND